MTSAKTRFVVAITQKLSAAPDSDAKLELIEELSENLHSRYQDMVGDGVPECEAYERALEELGDVEELLAYLNGSEPDGAPPRTVQVSDGGGEYGGSWIPSENIRSVEVRMASGDVTVSFDPDPNAPVRLAGELEELQVSLDETGQLTIRQGKTASSIFFFLRALRSADIELILPRRHWERLRIAAASGDVDIEAGLVTDRLHVETASGDLSLCHADCGELVFQSANGDFDGENLTGAVSAKTMSGDISLSGMRMLRTVCCTSVSGDVSVWTDSLPDYMELSSKSGDCEAEVPDGEGFSVQFSTVSGDVSCGFPLSGSIGRHSGKAVYLDGGTAVLSLSSVSGDIALQRR